MRLSEDKISHLSHVILKGLMDRDLLDIFEEAGAVRKIIKAAIVHELKLGDEIETAVRTKIESQSKNIVEGSPEWEVLFKKYHKEEEAKRGRH